MVLTRDDVDREARCWIEPSLDTLRARGASTGLAAFLHELEIMVRAMFGGRGDRR